MNKKEYISTNEAAKIMGISRIAVFKQIKSGKIDAKKIGNSYIIDRDSLGGIYRKITPKDAENVNKAVDKVIKEFAPALRRLGKE